jgi:V/A-type H+-transporting ATPase subunit F
MPRIVALGPAEEMAPYLAMGAEVLEARDPAGVARALGELARDKSAAVVLLSESQAEAAGEAVADFRTKSAAALVVLPGSTGSKGLALAEMKSFLERAIGVDLIGKE